MEPGPDKADNDPKPIEAESQNPDSSQFNQENKQENLDNNQKLSEENAPLIPPQLIKMESPGKKHLGGFMNLVKAAMDNEHKNRNFNGVHEKTTQYNDQFF